MDEETWVAAMRAAPHDLATMAAFADWLLEAGDRRGEILVMMVNDGKVGDYDGYYGGPHLSRGREGSAPCTANVGHALYVDAIDPLRDSMRPTSSDYRNFNDFCDPVSNRLAVMAVWAGADDARRAEYLADYLKTL